VQSCYNLLSSRDRSFHLLFPPIPNERRKPSISPTHTRSMIFSRLVDAAGVMEEPISFHLSLSGHIQSNVDGVVGQLTNLQEFDDEVAECSDNDVLSGRGKSNLKHPGNQKYQGKSLCQR
jgi:hypothetical protein